MGRFIERRPFSLYYLSPPTEAFLAKTNSCLKGDLQIDFQSFSSKMFPVLNQLRFKVATNLLCDLRQVA